jgi:hypothetical protein
MSQLRTFYLAAALALAPASLVSTAAMADAVLDWNELGVAAVLAARQSPPESARSMAMMHVAVFNAVNAIEQRYAPYGFEGRAPAGASANAAATAAAHVTLVKMFPEQREALDKAYAASMQKIAGERGLEAGVALGERAADDCVSMRLKDGVGAANVYRPVTAAGVYVSTVLPVSHDWREVKTWVMKQPAQFRPEPPPALTSATWTRDYAEIKEVGAKASPKRSPEQTEVARFWTAVGGRRGTRWCARSPRRSRAACSTTPGSSRSPTSPRATRSSRCSTPNTRSTSGAP